MSKTIAEIVDKLQTMVDNEYRPRLEDHRFVVVDKALPPDHLDPSTLVIDHHGPEFNKTPSLISSTLLVASLLAAMSGEKQEVPHLHPAQTAQEPRDLDELLARTIITMWRIVGFEKTLIWIRDNPRLLALLNLSEFFLLDPNYVTLRPEKPTFPYRYSVYVSPRDVTYLWLDIGTSKIPKEGSLLDFLWQKQLCWIVEQHLPNCPDSFITLVRTGMNHGVIENNHTRKRSASSILVAGIWGQSQVMTVEPSLQKTLDEFVLLTKALDLTLVQHPELSVRIHKRSRNQLTLTEPARTKSEKKTVYHDIGLLIEKALRYLACEKQ